MTDLSLSHISPDLLPVARFATATLHALAREEAAGRKTRRLLEQNLATWRQFCGRMDLTDFMLLLLEDAAVTQPFAFSVATIMGSEGLLLGRLPASRVEEWISSVSDLDPQANPSDYVTDQARRLELPTRLARSDLHRGLRPHHRVLELPGTGGQLAHYLTQQVEGLPLRDVFTITWSDWPDRLLAGLVGVEAGLTGSAPITIEAGIGEVSSAGSEFDYVIGAEPSRGSQPYQEADLQGMFPGATVILV